MSKRRRTFGFTQPILLVFQRCRRYANLIPTLRRSFFAFPTEPFIKRGNLFLHHACVPVGLEVYSGDFNGDGKPDFMAVKYSGGWVALFSREYCTGIFAFSDGDGNGTGYGFTRVRSMDLSSGDLVIDPVTRQFRLIQTSHRAAISHDGRYHSFWVHRFYMWNGASL